MKEKLEEGQTYSFVISDLVKIPEDQEYFKLIDPNNVKHLLEVTPYKNYNFEKGLQINCRIDKINCTGKVFIEPEHPYYKLNQIYEFPLIRMGTSEIDMENDHAYFKDVFGNEIEIPSDEVAKNPIIGNSYKFQVTRIKKGQIYISKIKDRDIYKNLEVGKEYPFNIEQLRNYAGKYTYFILKNPNGNKFKLRSKFYINYQLKLGQTIHCRLLEDGDEKFLEPRHPHFRIGKTYDFEIEREDFIKDYPNDELEVFVLRNDYGKEQYIPKTSFLSQNIRNGMIRCKVTDIRKSRLYLNCGK